MGLIEGFMDRRDSQSECFGSYLGSEPKLMTVPGFEKDTRSFDVPRRAPYDIRQLLAWNGEEPLFAKEGNVTDFVLSMPILNGLPPLELRTSRSKTSKKGSPHGKKKEHQQKTRKNQGQAAFRNKTDG